MISRVEVDASKLETEEDRYKEFAAEAVTEDNAEQTVDNKEQRRGLDCLQQHGVRDMSAKGHIVTETTGAEKDRVTVTETKEVEKGDYSTVEGRRQEQTGVARLPS